MQSDKKLNLEDCGEDNYKSETDEDSRTIPVIEIKTNSVLLLRGKHIATRTPLEHKQ